MCGESASKVREINAKHGLNAEKHNALGHGELMLPRGHD